MKATEQILSICESPPKDEDFFAHLAKTLYALEQNGDPEDHAKKLTTLFKDSKQAIKWLRYYAEQTQALQPLHDLCMHIQLTDQTLPHLAHFGEGNLKYLFSELSALETLTLYHHRIIKQDEINKLKTISLKEKIHDFLKFF